MDADPIARARRQRQVHGPDWRWQLAEVLATCPAPQLASQADEQVLEARAYLQQRLGRPEPTAHAPPDLAQIAAAAALAHDSAICRALKVLVVGGCPPAEIAERFGLDAKVLATWESVFFDVREARAATDWIAAKVIQPEAERGDGHLAAQLKFACIGGPVAARAVVDAESRLSLRQGVTLFDRKIRLNLLCDQALTLPLDTDRNKLFFIKLHTELMSREGRLRLAERRLEQRSQEALDKQQLAEARLALAIQRAEEQAARSAEREARARKQDERKAWDLQRQANRRARTEARAERRQAARERAATSALGQLRWEFSSAPSAESGPVLWDGAPQEAAGVLCRLPEAQFPSQASEHAALGVA